MPLDVPRSWGQLIETLQTGPPGRIYVMGMQDRGKSTLSRLIAENLSGKERTALVDADPGQGELGPPATMGWIDAQKLAAGHDEPGELHFVGATSPGARFMSSITALGELAESAGRAGARAVVIDSCGWVLGETGQRFQLRCLDTLRPEHVVVLEEGHELDPLTRRIERRFLGRIHRLEPSERARPRSPATRQERREERYRAWLSRSKELDLAIEGVPCRGLPGSADPRDWVARLVAACFGRTRIRALGVVRAFDPGRRIRILGRRIEDGPFDAIQFGEHRIDREGRHD